MTALHWNNSTLLDGDRVSAIIALKAQAGHDLQTIGSGDLIQTLQAASLVDEYNLLKMIMRVVVHLLWLCGLLVLVIMPSNKYTWMQDLDPSIARLPADGTSDSRAIVTFLILMVIVAAELGLAFLVENKKEKVISVVLVLLAIAVWLW